MSLRKSFINIFFIYYSLNESQAVKIEKILIEKYQIPKGWIVLYPYSCEKFEKKGIVLCADNLTLLFKDIQDFKLFKIFQDE